MTVTRLFDGPIITRDMLPDTDGYNINSPCVIRAPSWLENPLGTYYMYFSSHFGKYIRLAYSNNLKDWSVVPTGCVVNTNFEFNSIATPCVLIDEDYRRLVMFFQAKVIDDIEKRNEYTWVASSTDGINFTQAYDDAVIPAAGVNVIRWIEKLWFAIDNTGLFWAQVDPFTQFTPLYLLSPLIIPYHSYMDLRGLEMDIYYNIKTTIPGKIYKVTVDQSAGALYPFWSLSTTKTDVIEPVYEYEGSDVIQKRSQGLVAFNRENSLRDPYIFNDIDGKKYLFYTCAGEYSIAIAEIS